MSSLESLDVSVLAAAADRFHELGTCFDSLGLTEVSRHLFASASEIDRILPPPPIAWWSRPFNGQDGRIALFLEILGLIGPAALLETGTYRGTTTSFLAERFAGPIFTCEADPRWYLTGRTRLAAYPNVQVRHQDSRPFLRDALAEAPAGPVLVYLDAHLLDVHGLFADLPLREEIEIIVASGRDAVIFIDDFAVPGDAGYAHVDAGPGRTLSVELLAGLGDGGAGLFFPTLPSEQETGARRGCAVVGTPGTLGVMDGLAGLRRHDWPPGPPPAAPQSAAMAAPAPDIAPLRRIFELAELERRAAEAERRAAAAEAELRIATEAARREIDAFRASTSWRISAPIRALSRLVGR